MIIIINMSKGSLNIAPPLRNWRHNIQKAFGYMVTLTV